MLLHSAIVVALAVSHLPIGATVLCERLAGGTIKQVMAATDLIPVCRVGGAMLGAQTLLQASEQHQHPCATSLLLAEPGVPQDPHRSPAAAEQHCRSRQGEAFIVRDETGAVAQLCRFKDGSLVEVWTLLRGCNHPDNKALVAFLKRYA